MNAVEVTGYTADPFARTLRSSGNLGVVAVVVPDIGDPYFAQLYSHLQEFALARGEGILLGSHLEDYAAQTDVLAQLAVYRPAAVVLVPAPGTTPRDVEQLQAQGIGVVVVDRPVGGVVVDCVLAENEVGAEALVTSTVGPEDRVAVAMLPRQIWTQERRLDAVTTALGRRGLQPVAVVEETAALAQTSGKFSRILEQEPTVVISLSLTSAMGVLRQQSELGGPSMRIAAFDTHPWFDLITTEVTTASQNPRQVASTIDGLVVRRRAEAAAPAQTSVLPFALGVNRAAQLRGAEGGAG